MRASVTMRSVLAAGLLIGSLALAQSQPAKPLPDAPAPSGTALQHFQRATELYGQYQQMCAGVSGKGCGSSALNNAIAEYREALRLKPDYADAHNDLGNALDDLGQRDEAILEYQQAINLKPDFAKAHDNLGTMLVAKGLYDQANAEFRTAIALDPANATAHYYYCVIN